MNWHEIARRTLLKTFGSHDVGTYVRGLAIYEMFYSGKQGRLIDVGCGSGEHSLQLAKRGWRVLGIDIAKDNIRKAREKAQLLGMQNLEFVVADGYHLPFRDECFDAILCSEVIEHLQDDKLFISRICRVLRMQGFLVLSAPSIGTHKGIHRIPIRVSLACLLEKHDWLKNILISENLDPALYAKIRGHFREHTISDIEEKLNSSGMSITLYDYCYKLFSGFVMDVRWSVRLLSTSAGYIFFPFLVVIARMDKLLNVEKLGSGIVVRATKNRRLPRIN